MILPEFLFFDLDNTILDFRLAERNALAAAFAGIGIRPDDEMLDRYSVLNDEQWKLLETNCGGTRWGTYPCVP